MKLHRLRVGLCLELLTGALMLPVAGYAAASTARTIAGLLSNSTEMVDFLAFYTGARLLLLAPAQLYDRLAWTRVQHELHASIPPLEFWNPPHAALLLAQLGFMPLVPAYLVWLCFNLACLGAASYLLAPRSGRRSWLSMLGWVLLSALFLPAQLGLVMGQLSCALLLGFGLFVRFSERSGWIGSAVSLLPWTCKPQLLAPFLIALALRRSWRSVVLACALPLLLSLVVIAMAGPELVVQYAELARGAGEDVLTTRTTHVDAGQGVLGISQWLLGRNWLSSGAALVGTLGVYGLVAHAWRRGLRTDAQRNIQLAMLPIAAFLTSPHALPYDAVPWLGSLWLLLTFARDVPTAQGIVVTLLLVGWWGANLASLPGLSAIAPLGGFTALVELMLMTVLLQHPAGARTPGWLSRTAGRAPGTRRRQTPRFRA